MGSHRSTWKEPARSTRADQPSPELQKHIMGGRLTLDELFVDGRAEQVEGEFLAQMRMMARLRLIGAFVHAVDPRTRKGDCTSIVGCDGTVGSLVQYVTRNMRHAHAFVRPRDLPAQYSHLNSHWRGLVRDEARRLLLTEVLVGTWPGMSASPIEGVLGTHVLFDELAGRWVAGKLFIEEYATLRPLVGDFVAYRTRIKQMG